MSGFKIICGGVGIGMLVTMCVVSIARGVMRSDNVAKPAVPSASYHLLAIGGHQFLHVMWGSNLVSVLHYPECTNQFHQPLRLESQP